MEIQPSKNGSHDLIRIVLERLQAARTSLLAEIRTYPGPITGCDIHYQKLLERRQSLTQELGRLHNVAARPDPAWALSAFIRGSAVLDADDKAHLLHLIHMHATGAQP